MTTPTRLGQGVAQFLETIPEKLRNPEVFPTLVAATAGDYGPQADVILHVALGPAAAYGSDLNRKPRPMVWPADHAMHPTIENEWFFLVSTLTVQGPAGGRIALVTCPMRNTSVSTAVRDALKWSAEDNQVIDSLLKLTFDTPEETCIVQRAFNVRSGLVGGLELSTVPWRATIGADRLEGGAREPYPMRAHYEGENLTIDLVHERIEPYFLQGEDGYIPNGADAGWLYYSAAQLRTSGTIVHGTNTYEVTGTSWYDHQWGTADPEPAAAPTPAAAAAPTPTPAQPTQGWVWFGFNFEDGSAITFMGPHTPGEAPDKPLPGFGKLVLPGASAALLITGQVTLTEFFASPTTGTMWPCGWEFEIAATTLAGHKMAIHIVAEPWAKDQLGKFASLQEFYEGGADLTLTNTYTDTVVTGTGFCEAVGFEPAANWWARAKEWLEKNT